METNLSEFNKVALWINTSYMNDGDATPDDAHGDKMGQAFSRNYRILGDMMHGKTRHEIYAELQREALSCENMEP